MHGARWGWAAFIAAVAILFAAHKEEGASVGKQLPLLRQELKSLQVQLEQACDERNRAQEMASLLEDGSQFLELRLNETREELKALQAGHERLKQELARVSTDRLQMQQTIAGLQNERAQTKRNVEQLRQGLTHLLNQAESVAANLSAPAPGVALVFFDEGEELEIAAPIPVSITTNSFPTYSAKGIPLNKNP